MFFSVEVYKLIAMYDIIKTADHFYMHFVVTTVW